MRRFFIFIIFLLLAATGLLFWQNKGAEDRLVPVMTEGFVLTSTVFENNGNIPVKYTCDGDNVSPPLSFSGVPEGTKSLVLIVDDPDAPVGTFTHWILWNISAQSAEFAEDGVPEGAVEGRTDFGKVGWGGPCPPSGTHRYFFKLYSLDTILDLPQGASRNELETAMEGHILGSDELVGLYSR